MTLNEYKLQLVNDVKAASKDQMCSTRESFFNYASDLLIEVGEIQDFNSCYFENIGKRKEKILIDGYYVDSLRRELCLMVSHYEEIEYDKNITKTEVDSHFKHALNFIKNVDFIISNVEEASLGYQFAVDLKRIWPIISKIKIVVIYNQEVINSKKLQYIESDMYEDKRVSYSVWGADRFFKIYDDNLSHEKTLIDLKDYNEEGILALKASSDKKGDYESYLAIISGNLLSKIYDNYGARLLEGNVRSYLQNRGKVNREIRKTLITEPERFFAYNNGIAATANSIKTSLKEGSLYITELENFQIVNGGQTTASIFNVKYIEKKSNLEGVYVPMKLSIIDDSLSETLVPQISKTANTQNKVSAADFFSNHPFHLQMEKVSRVLMAPAIEGNQFSTKWFYERVRGQYRASMMKMTTNQQNQYKLVNPYSQVITKTDMAKVYNSIYGMPHEVSKGSQRNFQTFADYIAKEWIKSKDSFNDEFYKRIVVGKILFNSIEKIVSNAVWYEKAFRANIVTYSIAIFFNNLERYKYKNKTFNFDTIWIPQKMPVQLVLLFEQITYEVFKEITAGDLGRTKNITEWCKKVDCWVSVKKRVEFNLESIDRFLIDIEKTESIKKEAKKDQKANNKIILQIEVVNKGAKFWKSALEFGVKNNILFGPNLDIIKVAANMDISNKPPTEMQSKRLFEILNELEYEGFKSRE